MIWIYLILAFLVLFTLANIAALALRDFRVLKNPADYSVRGVFKSKTFWKWLWSINWCKHDQGFNYLDDKYKQRKYCGKTIVDGRGIKNLIKQLKNG